jgi:hypothetical protein
MNRPNGYGFVTKVAGVGGATLVSVKLQEQYDNHAKVAGIGGATLVSVKLKGQYDNHTHHKMPISHIISTLQFTSLPYISLGRNMRTTKRGAGKIIRNGTTEG